MTLVELINKYLKDNHLTKKEFAEAIGMHPGTCRNILNGSLKRQPYFMTAIESNQELYKDLCKYYGGKKKRPLKRKEEVIRERHIKAGTESVFY